MIRRSLAIAALAIGLASPALAQQSAAQDTARQQIQAFMNQWIAAYNRDDGPAMAALTTTDAFGVGDQGIVSGKERFERAVQNAEAFRARVTSMQVEEVRLIGRDAAVAAGPYVVTYNNPQPQTAHGTWMQVLQRQHGAWRSVAASYTLASPPTLPAGAANPPPAEGSTTR